MQVRVDQLVPYGYTDTAISTFHAFGDRLIREFALELGLPSDAAGPVAAGGRGLPARAPVRARAGRATGRSATRPGSSPPSPTLFRGPRTRTCRPDAYLAHAARLDRGRGGRAALDGPRGRGGRGPAGDTPPPRLAEERRVARAELGRAAYGRYQALLAAQRARSTSATRCASRCAPARVARGATRCSRRASGTCSWTSSRTRTAPRRSSSR